MNELVIAEDLLRDLRGSLIRDEDEAAAILLAQEVIQRDGRHRLLIRDVLYPRPGDYIDRSPTAAILTPGFVANASMRARADGEALVFAHSHPQGPVTFSRTDDLGERQLRPFLAYRLPDRLHASLLLTPHSCRARSIANGEDILVTEIGVRRTLHRPRASQTTEELRFDRQIRAFGGDGQAALAELSIAIVGLGGTGSVVAQQLAHLGVRSFLLVDPDVIEATNLNRVVGATPSDVGVPKVDVAKRLILSVAPDASVTTLCDSVLHAECSLHLAHSASWIWCCTDSHGSRAALNQIAYQYLIPCIDVGVAIVTGEHGITHITGRAQQLAPGLPCLLCSGLLNPEAVRLDFMRESERIRDPYFHGNGVPQPAVISLNSTVASLGMTMFLSSVTGIPGESRLQLLNAITGQVRSAVGQPHPTCLVCSRANGQARGDAWPLPAKPVVS